MGKYLRWIILSSLTFIAIVIVYFAMSGVSITDNYFYEKTDSQGGIVDIPLEINISDTHEEQLYFFDRIWKDYSNGPYFLNLSTTREFDGAFKYRSLVIREAVITFPDGSRKKLLADGNIVVDRKMPDEVVKLTRFKGMNQRSIPLDYYNFYYQFKEELPLQWKNHCFCRLKVSGAVIDYEGNVTPFSISSKFEKNESHHIHPFY